MFTVPNADTQIGVVLGPDIGNVAVGDATKWLTAFQTWAGWKQRPMAGSYLYPNYDNSQWSLRVYQGAGPMCWGSMVIPASYAAKWASAKKPTATEIAQLVTDLNAGYFDKAWSDLAALMVSLGHTTGIYRTGFEGNGNNFPGSAGQVGDVVYAQLMSRHISVMRQVAGWDFNVEWNYTVRNAIQNGLNPDKAWVSGSDLINTVGLDQYAAGGYTMQGWTAQNHDQVWTGDVLPNLEAQYAFADKHGLRLGVTEFGPMWKSDGHGEGDDRYFLDHFHDWVVKRVPAWTFLFNGSNLPGDECRVAKPTGTTTFAFVDNDRMKVNAAPAVKQLFDPANFKGRTPMPFSQADVDAAVATAVGPLNSQLAAALSSLTTQQGTLTAAQAALATAQAALADATAHLAADEAQLATDKTQLAIDATTAATLQSKLNAATTSLSTANANLKTVTASATALKAKIAKAKTDLG